jgi:hypothetical protein
VECCDSISTTYQSDGTQTETSQLLVLRSPFEFRQLSLAPAGSRRLFRKRDADVGSELWALEEE